MVVGGMPPSAGVDTWHRHLHGQSGLHWSRRAQYPPSVPTPLHIHFVVVNSGKQINQVVDADASIAIGIRVN